MGQIDKVIIQVSSQSVAITSLQPTIEQVVHADLAQPNPANTTCDLESFLMLLRIINLTARP